jgi:hypothetical protein
MKNKNKLDSIDLSSSTLIHILKSPKSEKVKNGILLIAALLVLLSVPSPVLASLPDFHVGHGDSYSGNLGISNNPSSHVVSNLNLPFTGSYRIGLVSDDVAEYKIKVNVGPGKYDNISLTNYVSETSPWHTNKNKNLIILPGQALTEKFYSDMAIYYAQQGYSAYVLDRRETNIPSTETDFSFMKKWTVDEQLKDTYKGIAASRNHTSFLTGVPAKSIKVDLIGHSHGALLTTAYKASLYDDLPFGHVDKIVPIDIIIKYDPKYSDLILGQAQEFNIISKNIESGTYQDSNMKLMMGIAYLAFADPNGDSSMPGFTNIQLFRLMASQTYTFSQYPYTPDYHYWSGNLNGLYDINENRLLSITLNGGAVPYAPMTMDQYMAGLMGNVVSYDIDPSKVDCPVLYVGLGGGFGDYGSWWYKYKVGKTNNHVTSMNWGNLGHASILIDYNSSELWSKINNWLSS